MALLGTQQLAYLVHMFTIIHFSIKCIIDHHVQLVVFNPEGDIAD